MLLLIAASIPLAFASTVIADEDTDIVLDSLTPEPLNPQNGEVDVAVTPVNFTWKGVRGTYRYKIELYSSDSMDKPFFSAETVTDATGYTYRGTLKYNTSYNWHVIGTDPPGDWSAVSWFTTEKQSATSAGDSGTAGSDQSSMLDSIKSMDTAMVIGIGIGVLALILIIVYFALPKKSSPGRPKGTRQRGFGSPPPFLCPSCGTENMPGQPFCWDCGSPLPPPQWGGPPIQQPPAFGGSSCPRCGAPSAPGEKFCSICGLPIQRSAQRQQPPPDFRPQRQPPSSMYGDPKIQPPPYNQQSPQSYTCPTCGSPVPYGRQACPNCGTQILW